MLNANKLNSFKSPLEECKITIIIPNNSSFKVYLYAKSNDFNWISIQNDKIDVLNGVFCILHIILKTGNVCWMKIILILLLQYSYDLCSISIINSSEANYVMCFIINNKKSSLLNTIYLNSKSTFSNVIRNYKILYLTIIGSFTESIIIFYNFKQSLAIFNYIYYIYYKNINLFIIYNILLFYHIF